jgi:hypothetical protein
MAISLSVLAGFMHVLAFWIYHNQMLKGFSTPQLGTWGLWVFISTMNCISYIAMSGDLVKGILPIMSTVACIWVFLKATTKKSFVRFDFWDKIVFWIGMTALGFWWYYRSATYGNLLLQISIVISFIPTYRGIWEKPETERKVLPWFVWSGAYLFTLTTVILRWEGQYQDIVYPVNGFVMHAGVGFLAIRKEDKNEGN